MTLGSRMGAIALGTALVAFVGATPAPAQESPAMKACSEQWNKLKEAGKTPKGQTWPKYWSECSKEYAAKHGEAKAADRLPPPPRRLPSRRADTAGAAEQKKACDAKWNDHKAKAKVHGWKSYFTFMAKCM